MKINYKLGNVLFEKGSVILAGAGPGSLEQVTLKVCVAISKADVIIVDINFDVNLIGEFPEVDFTPLKNAINSHFALSTHR